MTTFRYRIIVAAAAAALFVSTSACSESSAPAEPTGPFVYFDLATEEGFFTLPFPINTRIIASGTIDLSGFPGGSTMVDGYLNVIQAQSRGYALGGAVFFRFSDPLDPATLPGDGAPPTEPDASVFLVNVTANSPHYGERIPLWIKFEEGASKYIGSNWLGLLPHPGYPLQEGTTYAAVVTNRVLTTAGAPFERDRDFAWVMGRGGPASVERARIMFQPLIDYLAFEQIPEDEVVAATVFTTQSVVDFMHRAREAVHALPHPALSDLQLVSREVNHDLYEGIYDSPIFQQGAAPYRQTGGEILTDSITGAPIDPHFEDLRVAISVPNGQMPPAGWPVVLYAHGTGGDYMTFTMNGMATRLADVRDDQDLPITQMAVLGIDQVLHGPRNPTAGLPEQLFYNFENPVAGRDNSRQAAIDYFQLARLVETIDIASAPGTTERIRFDPDHLYFMGHSQGGITGALFVAAEPRLQASVLSGTGAHLLLTLLRRTAEFNIPQLLEITLNDGDYGPLDEFHPVLTLVQMFIEPADPLAYVRTYLRDVPGGAAPRNVFMSYGIGDTFTPNLTTETFATAAGIPPAGVVQEPFTTMELFGPVSPELPPVCDNYQGSAGRSSAVIVQYRPLVGGDGHFVIFENPVAIRQATAFLGTHVTGGCPTLID